MQSRHYWRTCNSQWIAACQSGTARFARGKCETEEDELIVEWANRISNRWKRITEIHATRFPPREKLQIKHRAKFLMENLADASGMTRALAEVEVAPAHGNEQGGFDPETFFAVTEERLAFAEPLDSRI